MDFSELFQGNKNCVSFSPNRHYLAACSQHRLTIRETDTLQIIRIHTCLDSVQFIEWSQDSSLILCAMYKRGIIQVWSVDYPEWTCKVDEGSVGLSACRWAPDNRHLLTTSLFNLHITLWSLVDKSVSYIKYPKLAKGGMEFTHDGGRMVLAERHSSKDYISIFDCEKWSLVNNFEAASKDLAGLCISPNGCYICIWESCVIYRLYIHMTSGSCICSYSAYDNVWEYALGIKTVKWSPTGQFLSIGSYDEKLRLINNITWSCFAEHCHPNHVTDENVIVYTEKERSTGFDPHTSFVNAKNMYPIQTRYDTKKPPVTIPVATPDSTKGNPKLGVGTVLYSPNCHYIATINDNMPNVVWIWDVTTLLLSVLLVHISPVTCIQWDPTMSRLAICTNSNRLYLWSIAGCVTVLVPCDPPVCIQKLMWDSSGSVLALLGASQFCMCYINSDNE